MFQLGASLCLFVCVCVENTGQRTVIHSEGFVVLISKQSRVLILENKREIRRCPGGREKRKLDTDLVEEWFIWE